MVSKLLDHRLQIACFSKDSMNIYYKIDYKLVTEKKCLWLLFKQAFQGTHCLHFHRNVPKNADHRYSMGIAHPKPCLMFNIERERERGRERERTNDVCMNPLYDIRLIEE